MIVFDLKCSKDHSFEEWFDSSADYEAKAAAGAIACPKCGDRNIAKALMAPNISAGAGAAPSRSAPCAQAAACGETSCPMAGPMAGRS